MGFLVDFCMVILVLCAAFALGVTTLTLVRELKESDAKNAARAEAVDDEKEEG